jgi:hypothetical protein
LGKLMAGSGTEKGISNIRQVNVRLGRGEKAVWSREQIQE